MTQDQLPIILIAALVIGLAKGGLGGTLAGIVTPITSIFMPVQVAVGLLLPLLMMGDWLSLYAYWKEWDTDVLKRTLPAGIIGIVLGTYLLANLPGDVLRVILGIASLLIGFYKLMEARLQRMRYEHRHWHGHVAGFVSGTGSALANAGGPTYTAYLLLLRTLSPRAFTATTLIYFAIGNIIRLPSLMINEVITLNSIGSVIWLTPLVVVGVWLGRRFILWVDPFLFERLMILLLLIAGVVLIIGA